MLVMSLRYPFDTGLCKKGAYTMSNYDFECKECGKEFSIKKSINETAIPTCPTCESPNLKNNAISKNSGGCSGAFGGGCGCS